MNCFEYCGPKLNDFDSCPERCHVHCPSICKIYANNSENSTPPPPTLFSEPSSGHSTFTKFSIIACVLAVAFTIGFCWVVFSNFYSKWKNLRRRNMNSRVSDDTYEDFLDGNHSPVLDHLILYINSVGLQQSTIDSITVFKFKKDDGLFDGTDCSVCLSEFEEDERVRILPKCDHAFHLHCIDTWLRSHKNCPLCRAPIVRDEDASLIGVVSSNEANSDGLGSMEDTQLGNSEHHEVGIGNGENGEIGFEASMEDTQLGNSENHEVGIGNGENGEIGFEALPVETGRISKILEKGSSRNAEFRVQSDFAVNRRAPEHNLQPVRRSVSLDSYSASVIYRAMANFEEVEHEGEKNSNSGKLGSTSSSSGSSTIYKMFLKSSSIGRSSQIRPISMKRSFLSGRKISASRHSSSTSSSRRTRTFILPL